MVTKLREAQNYMPKGIQNKNKFYFIERSMEPDPFIQILRELGDL